MKLAQGRQEIANFPVNLSGSLINPLLPACYSNSGVGLVNPPHQIGPSEILQGFDPYDLSVQRRILNTEIGEVLSRLKLSASKEEKEVPPDDRTIFLTFSKGYPISQNELNEFFTM